MYISKLSSPGFRVYLWVVPIWDATWYQPHRLRSHSHHQAGVAFPLGCRPGLHLHAWDHRHLFRHRHFRSVQRHPHRTSVRPGDELCAANRNLPVLRHHVPYDRNAGCGGLFIQEDFLGLGDVFQLCSAAHQNQQDTPHFWTREEVCNSTQVRTTLVCHYAHTPLGPLCECVTSLSVVALKVAVSEISSVLARVFKYRLNLQFFLTKLPAIIIHHYFFHTLFISYELTLTYCTVSTQSEWLWQRASTKWLKC